MKHNFLFSILAFSTLLPAAINAQVNNAEFVTVPAGTFMNIQGTFGLLNNPTGNINNSGTIIMTGDYTNNGVFISGPSSLVRLEGPYQNIGGTNPTTFNDLEISGTGNKRCKINEYIAKTLIFDPSFPAKVIIKDFDLTLLSFATTLNADNSKFVVTKGTSSLVKRSVPLSADFLFPVGNDTLTYVNYKPVTLNYTGTIDTFAVRVEPGVVPTTGSYDSYCVQYTYHVKESNIGGSSTSLKLGWNSTLPDAQDEGTSFSRPLTYMWQYRNTLWNVISPTTPGNLIQYPLPTTTTDYSFQTPASAITDFSTNAQSFILRNYQILSFVNPPDTTQSTCENITTTFSVDVAGTDVLYQWLGNCGSGWDTLTDGALYSGTQTDILTVINPDSLMTGCKYKCIAWRRKPGCR